MRVKSALKLANAGAAVAGLAMTATAKDFALIPFVLILAAALHLLIDAGALLRRSRYARRLGDLGEFSAHRAYAIKDLEEALAGAGFAGASLVGDVATGGEAGIRLPALVEGQIAARRGQGRRSPLSGDECLAWRLEAELLEGLAGVPGPTQTVDAHWGSLELSDGTGTILLGQRGILDAGGLREKRFGLASLRAELPDLADRTIELLGLSGDRRAASARILLREVSLRAGDRVRAYGQATLQAGGGKAEGRLLLEGSEVLDDPASLLVRAAKEAASSRMPRARGRALALGLAGLVLAAGALGLALGPLERSLAKPGALLDTSRRGPVSIDLDGSASRVVIAGKSWDFEAGDRRKGLKLLSDDSAFIAARDARVAVYDLSLKEESLEGGDEGYPRWDGSAWILEPGRTEAAKAATAGGRGRLYIRNLSKERVGIHILGPGAPDVNWSFKPLEAADDATGHYLSFSAGGEPSVDGATRVEISGKDASRRVLVLGRSALWRGTGSWLLELAPELLGGSGKLYVANRGERPLRIWIMGADGAPLYGSKPWLFDAGEGTTENRGLSLQIGDKDIVFTGREGLRLAYEILTPRFEGSLEKTARRSGGGWALDASKPAR